ncbi:DUF4168 domain-containing protein [Croceicoccus naphthovorans]|nr:DUF4168 domain-containing protein [Croceicoccus naphthovorans]MBB3990425.1 Ni/Co efflux regulator RcnB [Croceicoccus naphthovorans]
MKKLLTTAAIVAGLAATPALAQAEAAADTAAPEATTAEAPAVAPAKEAAAEAAAPISDAELDQFAIAATKVNEIAQDATLTAEQKQAAMVEAVNGSGLDATKFNEIATKSQSDEALKDRLAEAFARRPAPAASPEAAEASEEQAGG